MINDFNYGYMCVYIQLYIYIYVYIYIYIFASTKAETDLLQPAPPLEPSAAPVAAHASSGSKGPWLLRV